jgi:hypothetical protein
MRHNPRRRPSLSSPAQPGATVSSHAVLPVLQLSMTQGRGRQEPSLTGLQKHHLPSRRKFRLVLPALLVILGLWGLSMPSRDKLQSKVQEKSASTQKSPRPMPLTPNDPPRPSSSSADTATFNVTNTTLQKLNTMTPALPRWMKDYVEFYHSQLQVSATTGELSLKPDAKYLLWTCRSISDRSAEKCGGIGDRLNGIVQGLYMAICTNRVLLVDWDYPDPLTALEPVLLPWNLKVNVPPAHTLHTIDKRQHMFLLDPSKIPDDIQGFELWSNLWLYEPIVRQTQCLRDYWEQHGGLDDSTQLYQTAFRTLFKWSPAIVQHTADLKRRASLSTLTLPAPLASTGDGSLAAVAQVRPYIALHVRTGVGASWVDPVRHAEEEDLRRFYQCARTIQQGIRDLCPPTARPSSSSSSSSASRQQQQDHQSLLDIYVASDNSDAKETLQQWDAEDCRQQTNNISTTTFRSTPHLEVFHIDRSQTEMMRDPAAAALDVWGELSTLLDAVCLVTSASKFSYLPTWLSPQQPRCQVQFDHCSPENVTMALQALRNAGCPLYN